MTVMLEGLLVDLVPYDDTFTAREHTWANNESSFWSNAGERSFATRDGICRWLERVRESRAQRAYQQRIMFGIRTKDGVPIGHISISRADPTHRLARLGASIGEADYWGGGYGTDALLLVCDYAFRWLDARKIWLETADLNVRVQRQMQKVGFTLEGQRRHKLYMDGQRTDELLYGLLRDEWPGYAALTARLGLPERAARAADQVADSIAHQGDTTA